jgi:exopolysaccharide biosynthesis WecB/TagA/CpsF family protein
MKHVLVGGVPACVASRAELMDAMTADCRARRDDPRRRARLVFDTNGHAISLSATDPDYRAALEQADIVHADSAFVVAASRYVSGSAIPERSATTDMIHDAATRCVAEGLSFYLLGAPEEINARAAAALEARYPGLRLAGRRNGYFRPEEEEEVLADIARARPDVVWVGLGKPREQLFCLRHADRIDAAWVVTAGGCLNFLAGDYARAPVWMQAAGLEWLHRFATGPAYLKARYAKTIPHAIWLTTVRRDRALLEGHPPRPAAV